MYKSIRLFDYRQTTRFFSTLLLIVATLLVGGCGGSADTTTGYVTTPGGAQVAIKVNSAAEIAQVSDADYNNNVNGLITGTTLQYWIDDWQNNRPAGITGRLIILQISNGAAGQEYITPKPLQGVLTYSIVSDTSSNSRLVMHRSNGVTTTRAIVLDGTSMDKFLHDYGIDPSQDMIVFAMGKGGYYQNMQMGRGWYLFRYWGVTSSHLAMLDGGADSTLVMDPSYLGSTATCDENALIAASPGTFPATCPNGLPESGQFSVKNLVDDNTILQATMEDMMNAIGNSNVFIWDARSPGEYGATKNVKTADAGNPDGIDFRNGDAKQGHPYGALNLRYKFLLTSDGSYRYKNKVTLQKYLDGETVDAGEFLSNYDAGGPLTPVGAGNAYHPGQTIFTYCETTYRAMITGTAAGVILGLPVRFYDGAMVEWNSLANTKDANGQLILPNDSPWRTDTATRSVFSYNTQVNTAPRVIDNAYASHADAVILADKAYKAGATTATSGGGTGSGSLPLPPNPCGG